jgi:hypothetical protein
MCGRVAPGVRIVALPATVRTRATGHPEIPLHPPERFSDGPSRVELFAGDSTLSCAVSSALTGTSAQATIPKSVRGSPVTSCGYRDALETQSVTHATRAPAWTDTGRADSPGRRASRGRAATSPVIRVLQNHFVRTAPTSCHSAGRCRQPGTVPSTTERTQTAKALTPFSALTRSSGAPQ